MKKKTIIKKVLYILYQYKKNINIPSGSWPPGLGRSLAKHTAPKTSVHKPANMQFSRVDKVSSVPCYTFFIYLFIKIPDKKKHHLNEIFFIYYSNDSTTHPKLKTISY